MADNNTFLTIALYIYNCIDMNIGGQGTVGKFNNAVHYCDIPDNGFDRRIDDDGIEEIEYGDDNEGTAVSLTRAIAFTSGKSISNGNQTVSAQMKASGNYKGKVGVFIYDYEQDQCVSTLQAKTVSLHGGKSSNVSFSGIVNLSEGNYFAAIFYTDHQGQWQLMGEKSKACVPFTIGNTVVDDNDDLAVVEEDDDNVSPFADDEEDMMIDEEDDSYQEEDSYDEETEDVEEEYLEEEEDDEWVSDDDCDYDFGEEEEDDDGNYGFFDFIDDLFSKGTAQDVSITCKKMQIRDVEPSLRDGHSVYDFQRGQSAKLDFVLNNNQKDDETRILTVSLYDKDDQWVADLAEKLVNVDGKQQKKGTFFLRFSDIQPGAYKLRMTEAMGDDDVCSPVFPAAASSLYIQVKR